MFMNLDIIKWKDFYLSDVFTKIEPGKVSQAYQLEEGVDIPYLGAKKMIRVLWHGVKQMKN